MATRRPSPALHAAIATALAVAACTGAPAGTAPPTPAGTKRPGPAADKASATPGPDAPTPTPSPAASGSAAPPATPTPPAGGTAPPGLASTSPLATPTTGASATPGLVATPTPDPLRSRLASKLVTLAAATYTFSRGGLVANNGGSLLSDQGGTLISDQGVGIIGNHGGSILSDAVAGYRLAQAAPLIDVAPKAGEIRYIDTRWPDGSATLAYTPDFEQRLTSYRNIDIDAGGLPFHERASTVRERFARGAPRVVALAELYVHREGAARGQLHIKTTTVSEHDEATGLPLKGYMEPGGQFRDPVSKSAIDVEQYACDLAAGTLQFKLRMPGFGLVETGANTGVALDAQKAVSFVLDDPLALYDGQSRLETTAGKLLYTRTRRATGTGVELQYDLQDGVTMKLDRESYTRASGRLSVDGVDQGRVVYENRFGGTVIFTVELTAQPGDPLVVGYGDLAKQAPSPPPPASPATYWVETAAGGATAGFADGLGDGARFRKLGAIAASRLTPGKFYLADNDGHRIRTATFAGGTLATIGTLAGDGTEGYVDGPGAGARFDDPHGIAVGPDDTVYVADVDNHAIRAIAPDGTVRTIAGGKGEGFADGGRDAARLKLPHGVALDPQGRVVFADTGNARIRRVEADGQVVTLAGDGTAAFRDGAALQARFNGPLALAIRPDGAVLVADLFNFRVRQLQGGQVSTVVGDGDRSHAFLDGPAGQNGLGQPLACTLAPDGTLYVATSTEIRYLTPAGEVRTYAAGWQQGDYLDGSHKDALFKQIRGLAVGPRGELVVGDATRLRRVLPPGYYRP